MKSEHKAGLGGAAIFTFLGCGLLLGAWFLTTDTRHFVADSYVADSVVVSVERQTDDDPDGDRRTYYFPKVKFAAKSGDTVEKQATWGTTHRYKRGERISLRVAGNDANRFVANTFSGIWGWSVLLWYIGSGFLLVGITVLITTMRQIASHRA
jgi:hypothetical protein